MAAAGAASPMTAARTRARELTLLDLVQSISDVTTDEREVVATVIFLLRTGRVRLNGNFRGAPVEELC